MVDKQPIVGGTAMLFSEDWIIPPLSYPPHFLQDVLHILHICSGPGLAGAQHTQVGGREGWMGGCMMIEWRQRRERQRRGVTEVRG